MNILNQALAAGYSHVSTLSGPLPLQLFHLRDALGMTYSDGVIYSPWRPATALEQMHFESLYPPMIGLQARDKWTCIAPAQPHHAT